MPDGHRRGRPLDDGGLLGREGDRGGHRSVRGPCRRRPDLVADPEPDDGRRGARPLREEPRHPDQDVLIRVGLADVLGEPGQDLVGRRPLPVDEPVGDLLRLPPDRLERHGDDRGRDQRDALGDPDERTDHHHHDHVDRGDERRERAVRDRLVEDQVDLVEVVLHHRDADRDVQARATRSRRVTETTAESMKNPDAERHGRERRRRDEPLQLQPSPRRWNAGSERRARRPTAAAQRPRRAPRSRSPSRGDVADATPHNVDDLANGLRPTSRREDQGRDHEHDEDRHREPDDGRHRGVTGCPVGNSRNSKMRPAIGIGHSDVAHPCQRPARRQGPGLGHEGMERVGLSEARERERDPRDDEDPTDRVPRLLVARSRCPGPAPRR